MEVDGGLEGDPERCDDCEEEQEHPVPPRQRRAAAFFSLKRRIMVSLGKKYIQIANIKQKQ